MGKKVFLLYVHETSILKMSQRKLANFSGGIGNFCKEHIFPGAPIMLICKSALISLWISYKRFSITSRDISPLCNQWTSFCIRIKQNIFFSKLAHQIINKCEINLGFLVMHNKLQRMYNHFRVFVQQVGMGNQIEWIVLLFQPGAHLGSGLKLVLGFRITLEQCTLVEYIDEG